MKHVNNGKPEALEPMPLPLAGESHKEWYNAW
jgi:hypothetical protein